MLTRVRYLYDEVKGEAFFTKEHTTKDINDKIKAMIDNGFIILEVVKVKYLSE